MACIRIGIAFKYICMDGLSCYGLAWWHVVVYFHLQNTTKKKMKKKINKLKIAFVVVFMSRMLLFNIKTYNQTYNRLKFIYKKYISNTSTQTMYYSYYTLRVLIHEKKLRRLLDYCSILHAYRVFYILIQTIKFKH